MAAALAAAAAAAAASSAPLVSAAVAAGRLPLSPAPLLPTYPRRRPVPTAAGNAAAAAGSAGALLPLLAVGLAAAVRRRASVRGGRTSATLVARGANFGLHARDPQGVRHIETRKQAREASTIKTTLESIFERCEIPYRRLGDDEIQRRIRIDDVIMSKGCRSAYIHVGAMGDKLERRQAYVWLVRNKGGVKTALARRFKRRGRLPNIYFVESRFDEWAEQIMKGRRHPGMNLPDPFAGIQEAMDKKAKVYKRMGVGDENAPVSPWGYGYRG
mmetsp:Transcript_116580/g.324888  ORF Transcript_116580/g.324888 Transcript_116580/m.324888 type:complete len:272 (+) Transcript_116580:79-894(+)